MLIPMALEDENSDTGIVYVLTNPAMRGLVKIGKTQRSSIDEGLRELYSTGVPYPFDCAYAAKVENFSEIEKALHVAFGPYRDNPKREFFQIEPEQAIALLRFIAVEDVTPEIQLEAESVDKSGTEAGRKYESRRPNLNFVEMNIPVGSEIYFTEKDECSARVVSERKVVFGEEEFSLTALTRNLLNLPYSVAPARYWNFQGRNLNEIYNEIYE